MQIVQWTENPALGTITAYVCRDCEHIIRGQEPPPPEQWHTGVAWPFYVCGICRLALRDDDEGQPIRLHADDVAGTGIQPGAYSACKDCVAHFAVVIHWRLAGEFMGKRLAGEPAPHDERKVPALAVFGGDWLL
jgi:hypothetical protein